jgi:trans-L-3-hydroxyproline dehydratase
MIRLLKTIDAHAGGQPLRLVVDGVPRPRGRSLLEQRQWMATHADSARRALALPPRGHEDLLVAMLTDPVSPHAHAGILFMDGGGYPSMSGHAIVAASTIAVERSLLFSRDLDDTAPRLVFETPAGIVRAEARLATHDGGRRVDRVRMTNVPAFVHAASTVVKLGARHLRVDVAFGGAFFAIVDSESTGIALVHGRVPELRRLGVEICAALDATASPQHPAEPALGGIAGVVFTGPPRDPEGHLRNVTVSRAGGVDLSAGGAGTSAVLAVLDAMGVLPDGQPFVHEGLSGSLLRGRVAGRTEVGGVPAVVTDIEGSAWVTGEHTFLLDDDDPFRDGIDLPNQ